MYTATKRPWSVWRDADTRPLRDARRLHAASLIQRLGQYHHLNIDWARFDLPNMAIFVPANFDRVDQLGRSTVAPKRLDNRWWNQEMYPRTYIMPTPQVKTYLSHGTEWAYLIWLVGALTLFALPGLLMLFKKILFNFRRCQSSEWERPSVRATAVPLQSIDPRTGAIAVSIPPPTTLHRLDSIFENELPPPYPACVSNPRQHQNPSEDPPPPYSECCVAFSNTNEPQVHFYINQSNNLPDDNFVSKIDINDTRQDKGNEVTDTNIEGSLEGRNVARGAENSGTNEDNTKAFGNSNGSDTTGLDYVTLSFDLPECAGTNERTNEHGLPIA